MDTPPTVNPYAPPEADIGGGPAEGPEGAVAEKIRKDHLKHEASIRGLGALWGIGGSLSVLLSLLVLIFGILIEGDEDVITSIFFVTFLGGPGAMALIAGIDLRNLRARGRTTGTIIAALSLLSIPIGTFIGAYALYLLHSQKGHVVMSEQYADIRRRTPHIKYKTSIIVWIFLGLLIMAIGAAILAAVL